MKEFEKLTRFIHLTHQFQNVKRTNLAADTEHRENNAEHSFQIAIVAWFLADLFKLRLNRERLLKYALVHDLAEVYAGDVDPHYSSKEKIKEKPEVEKAAMIQLKQKFAEFSELHEAQKSYHDKEDAESKFVYALDKLLCLLNIHMINDPYYVVLRLKKGISILDDMRETHRKVKQCAEIRKLYDHLMEVVESKK